MLLTAEVALLLIYITIQENLSYLLISTVRKALTWCCCTLKISEAKQRKASLEKAVEKAKVGRQDTVSIQRSNLNQWNKMNIIPLMHWACEIAVCLCRRKEALCWRSCRLWERSAHSCRPSWRSTESVTPRSSRRWVSTAADLLVSQKRSLLNYCINRITYSYSWEAWSPVWSFKYPNVNLTYAGEVIFDVRVIIGCCCTLFSICL